MAVDAGFREAQKRLNRISQQPQEAPEPESEILDINEEEKENEEDND